MYVLKYLWAHDVLSACHLINRMPFFVLHGKILLLCLYPNKSVFSVALGIFSCTCFVQDFLLVWINYLLSLSVFFGYSRTHKRIPMLQSFQHEEFCACRCHVFWVCSILLSTRSCYCINVLSPFYCLFRYLHLLIFQMYIRQCHRKTLQRLLHHSL